MKPHQDLGRTVRVLAYLIKHGKVDPDKKIELFYTCSMDQKAGIDSSDFEKDIESHHFSDGQCSIGERFGEIVSQILNRK